MKNIFLTENQFKTLKKESEEEKKLPLRLFSALEEKEKNIPLGNVEFSKKLLSNGYKNIINEFSDNIAEVPLEKVVNHFNRLLAICQKAEKPIKPQLEEICYNTIVQLFNIPEDEINFTFELVDSIEKGQHFHISPDTNEDYEYNSVEDMDNEDIEVEKRRLVNSLVYGSALTLFEKSKKIYLNEIFDLNEELPHLYSKLTKINEYLLFAVDEQIKDDDHHQGGFAEVILGNDEKMSQINVKAVTFPILLIEAIKGVMELVSSNGLPDDFNTAKNVINKADILEEEPWDMRFGKELWKMVTLGNDIDNKIVPDFFKKLIDIDAVDFVDLMKELANNTKLGKEAISELIDDCKHNSEYNDFEQDILKKQDELSLINDSYFTEEELRY